MLFNIFSKIIVLIFVLYNFREKKGKEHYANVWASETSELSDNFYQDLKP